MYHMGIVCHAKINKNADISILPRVTELYSIIHEYTNRFLITDSQSLRYHTESL